MTHTDCCEECWVAREHMIAESTVEDAKRRVNAYGLTFAAISYRAAVRSRDREAASVWAWEMVEASGAIRLTDEQEQAIVDRHFADLIIAASDPAPSS